MQKAGLSQGFEYFNDSFSQTKGDFFRPFIQSINRALRWVDQIESDDFFMTLYVPDLLHKKQVTRSDLGEEREVSRMGQLHELSESLNDLIGSLKKRQLWNKSHFVFLGLGGAGQIIKPVNPLGSDLFHVPLQIKLAQGVRSNLGEIKGELLSFAKVGTWIEKILIHKRGQGGLLFSPSSNDPFISHESHLAKWRGFSSTPKLALRKRQFLFTLSPEFRVYDSFIDQKELEPVNLEEQKKLGEKFDITSRFLSFFPNSCLAGSENLGTMSLCRPEISPSFSQESVIALLNFIDLRNKGGHFESLSLGRDSENKTMQAGWLAYDSIIKKRWSELLRLGRLQKNENWEMVAQLNLGERVVAAKSGCSKFFFNQSLETGSFYRFCQDASLRKIIDGLARLRAKEKPSQNFWAEVSEIRRRRQ
ncbi:MAG: hypothetical protein AAF203_11015, partial [Pseudomonadota bacterium]